MLAFFQPASQVDSILVEARQKSRPAFACTGPRDNDNRRKRSKDKENKTSSREVMVSDNNTTRVQQLWQQHVETVAGTIAEDKAVKDCESDEHTTRTSTSTSADLVVVNSNGTRLRTSDTKPLADPYKRSILSHLLDRSTRGQRLQHLPRAPSWSPCPWLVLDASAGATSCMVFDKDGVLLATAMEKKVVVYDWDTVLASDFKGRIDKQKDVIQPILSFYVPYTISELCWNEHDHLLVSFRGTCEVYVYNMALIVDKIAPSAACTKLKPPRHVVGYQGPKCLQFLPHHHAIACFPCGTVCLWKEGSLVWSWKSSEAVSCLSMVADNLLLLGCVDGSFVLLDWKKTSRKAFSSDKTPTIVSTWKTQSLLKSITGSSRDLGGAFGVQSMKLETTVPTGQPAYTIGSCRITWITSGGWVLSMDLTERKVKVHNEPPAIKVLTSEGSVVAPTTKKYSSPSVPVLAAAGSIWQVVPRTTHVLPHHDKRVCQQRVVKRSKQIQLGCIDDDGRVDKLTLKLRPTSLTLHPSKEWLIIGTASKIIVLNARNLKTGAGNAEDRLHA